jgi:hypothetical protein
MKNINKNYKINNNIKIYNKIVYILNNNRNIIPYDGNKIIKFWKNQKDENNININIKKISFYNKENGWCIIQKATFGSLCGYCCIYLGIPEFNLSDDNNNDNNDNKLNFIYKIFEYKNNSCIFINDAELQNLINNI